MNETRTDRWGDFKTMSREELLLTKADLTANLARIKTRIEAMERRGEDVSRALYQRRCIMNAYERCNVYLGVQAAKEKRAESLAARFYALAKQQLDPATFQMLKQQAKTVSATPLAPSEQ